MNDEKEIPLTLTFSNLLVCRETDAVGDPYSEASELFCG